MEQQKLEIPFNKAYIAGRELYYIAQAVAWGELKGDGQFTRRCHTWFEKRFNVPRALLTNSCTAALEMAAILIEIEPGDEVILPSFTFTSTANAFLLRGAKLVFVDIRPDTLNMDEKLIASLVTGRTKAIVPMHYAGVGCEMDQICALAQKRGLYVVEDAAHAVMAKYKGKHLGTFGQIGTFSFHETKNYSSGEGGAIILNQRGFVSRAEILREKGTNRSQFFRGEVDKYSWVDVGSSYLPSEIIAAFLYGQLEKADAINEERLSIWRRYYSMLSGLQEAGMLRLPVIPPHCEHNAHMFYILVDSLETRTKLIEHLKAQGIGAVFHYVPLHNSVMGQRLGYRVGDLPRCEELADRLLRLPLFCGLSEEDQARVCSEVCKFFGRREYALERPLSVANV